MAPAVALRGKGVRWKETLVSLEMSLVSSMALKAGLQGDATVLTVLASQGCSKQQQGLLDTGPSHLLQGILGWTL